MPVVCRLRKTTGVLKDKDAYFVEPMNYTLINSDALLQYVEQNFQTHGGQVLSAVYSVVKQMVAFLQNGHRVQVPGLGIFSIKMKGDVVRDGDGVLQLENAKYAGINFTPDKAFSRQMWSTKFVLSSHNAPLVYSQLDDDQAMEIVHRLCDKQGEFLIQEFGAAAQCSRTYARKMLNQLVEKGKLVKTGGRFRLPQQQ